MGCKKKLKKVVKKVTSTVKAVVKNPLPTIATIALTSVGVPAPVSAAAVTALQGGSIADVAKAAAAGYAGQAAGEFAGKTAITSGASQTMAKIAANAAGQTTAAFIASGGDIEQALTAGVLAGATTGIIETGKGMLTQGGAQTPSTVPTSPYGTTEQVTATSPYGTVGTLSQPSVFTPEPSFWQTDTGKMLAKEGESVLSSAVSSSLSDLLGLSPKMPSAPTGTATAQPRPAPTSVATTGQGAAPGSAALAQALRVDPGATLGGGDQSAPRNVWNLASLRVKDETGG